jgi:hypothetical protein
MNNLYKSLLHWINFQTETTESYVPTDKTLAEAFKELGRLRLENTELRESEQRNMHWIEQAKERAGFHSNTSFDDVFEKLVECADQVKRLEDDQKNTK